MEWIGIGFDLDLIWIEIGVSKISRNVLARPVMGTIFLVMKFYTHIKISVLPWPFYSDSPL